MNLEKINQHELLERLKNGDETAFDRLFAHFYPGLLRYAKSMLPYPSDAAEDIVSDVFCSLWVNRSSITIRDSLAAYLYRSVKNGIINSYKKKRLRLVEMSDDVLEVVEQKYESPDSLFSYKEFNDRVNFLVAKLPEKTKLVFLMSREEGLTYEQIAEILDVSINTIKTHMFRAIRFLKAAFNPNDYLNLLALALISVFS